VIPQRKLEVLRDNVLIDDDVTLAVVFGPISSDAASISLLLDSRQSDIQTISRLTSALCRRVQEPLRSVRLEDARPAAMLMRQVLEEGQVLKDVDGVWEQLQSERDEIFREAEAHEQWASKLRAAVKEVVEADENVKLAVEFGPVGPKEEGDAADLNLLLGCVDEADSVVLDTYARLQETGFRIGIMQMTKARDFPYALSHIVRTGEPLKDENGEWEQLQSERDAIVKAAIDQHKAVQAAKRLYGGPGGEASLN
jgi:hypothetical protein